MSRVRETIKIEDASGPGIRSLPNSIPSTSSNTASVPKFDPKDPEGFLRRCSGIIKKKGIRCCASIARNSQLPKDSHLAFLPTCRAHEDQKSHAGWCRFNEDHGSNCGILFRWKPPNLQLCSKHQGLPDTPCYFTRLPLELRLEVFRYLLPSTPITSATSSHHAEEEEEGRGLSSDRNCRQDACTCPMLLRVNRNSPLKPSVFPTPLLDILLVSRQMYAEVKDLLYSSVSFTIDVRKEGIFMCGRRLLEPKNEDAQVQLPEYIREITLMDTLDAAVMKKKFLSSFNFSAVKNYSVNILVENMKSIMHMPPNQQGRDESWDEEVELYDIRDYVGVVVSGILAKSRDLCKLNVRLAFAEFQWTDEQLLGNINTVVGPFEQLRNVRRPRLVGVYEGDSYLDFASDSRASYLGLSRRRVGDVRGQHLTLWSVPRFLLCSRLAINNKDAYNEYRLHWERSINTTSPTSQIHKQPIRTMFAGLKDFYSKVSTFIPALKMVFGKDAFLHRARVAREKGDIESFRRVRNELIQLWQAFLEQKNRERDAVNEQMNSMLDTDVYPPTTTEPQYKRTQESQRSKLSLQTCNPSSGSSTSASSRSKHQQTQSQQNALGSHPKPLVPTTMRSSQTPYEKSIPIRSMQSDIPSWGNFSQPHYQQDTTDTIWSASVSPGSTGMINQPPEPALICDSPRIQSSPKAQLQSFLQSESRSEFRKRNSVEMSPEECEAKRARVQSRLDSGIEIGMWVDHGLREYNENGDEVVAVIEKDDVFAGWAEQQRGNRHVGSRKGKEVAVLK